MELGSILFPLFGEPSAWGERLSLGMQCLQYPSTISFPHHFFSDGMYKSNTLAKRQFLCLSLSSVEFIHILFLGEILPFSRLGRESG